MSGSTDRSVSTASSESGPRGAHRRIASRLRMALALAAAMVVAVALVANAWTGQRSPAAAVQPRAPQILRPAAAVPDPKAIVSIVLVQDGSVVGGLRSVDGCSAFADFEAAEGFHSPVYVHHTRDCTIRFAQLNKTFYAWITNQLRGLADPIDLFIVGLDLGGRSMAAIELKGASLHGFRFGPLDAADPSTLYFDATLRSEASGPAEPPVVGGTLAKPAKLLKSGFAVTLGGTTKVLAKKVGAIDFELNDEGEPFWTLDDIDIDTSFAKAGPLDDWYQASVLGDSPSRQGLRIDLLDDLLRVKGTFSASAWIFDADNVMSDPRTFSLHLDTTKGASFAWK